MRMRRIYLSWKCRHSHIQLTYNIALQFKMLALNENAIELLKNEIKSLY